MSHGGARRTRRPLRRLRARASRLHFAYFNELIGPRRNAHRILADSNLDWGQHRGELRAYLRAHPDTVYCPEQPGPGRFIADANVVSGVAIDRPGRWLGAFEPTDHVAYSYLVYEISPADLAHQPPGDGRE